VAEAQTCVAERLLSAAMALEMVVVLVSEFVLMVVTAVERAEDVASGDVAEVSPALVASGDVAEVTLAAVARDERSATVV